MPILIRQQPPPFRELAASPLDALRWALNAAHEALSYLRGLYTLDQTTREARTLAAERAMIFFATTVTNAAVVRLRDLAELNSLNADEPYTTALLVLDSASGAARWRIDGGSPTTTEGMQAAAGGTVITIVGLANIRDFAIIAEAGNVNLSGTLFK